MKKITPIFLIASAILLTSCSLFMKHDYYKVTTNYHVIHLERKEKQSGLTLYETGKTIICLNNQDIVKTASKKLQQKHLCEGQKKKYNGLIIFYNTHINQNMYYKEPKHNEVFAKNETIDTCMSGYFPLDFYTTSIINNTKYIDVDTLPFINKSDSIIYLSKFYDIFMKELIIAGNASVYNKERKKTETSLIDKNVIFSGHGGRNLLFCDSSFCLELFIYSDIVADNFDCLDTAYKPFH